MKKPFHTISNATDLPMLRNHPQADSIRKYCSSLGLNAQEQLALCENPKLLEHTLSMENMSLKDKFMKKSSKKGDEQCHFM